MRYESSTSRDVLQVHIRNPVLVSNQMSPMLMNNKCLLNFMPIQTQVLYILDSAMSVCLEETQLQWLRMFSLSV